MKENTAYLVKYLNNRTCPGNRKKVGKEGNKSLVRYFIFRLGLPSKIYFVVAKQILRVQYIVVSLSFY